MTYRLHSCTSLRAIRAVFIAASLTVTVACSAAVMNGHGTDRVIPSPSQPLSRGTGTTQSSPQSSPTVPVVPTAVQRGQQLEAQTNGEAHVIVRVPGGYEAATYDQSGNIQFWHEPTTSIRWTQVGRSTYPDIQQVGPPEARVRGALLLGMRHATFIMDGNFTGDASGNAVAFTTGTHGWGAIKAESNGNIGPSGHPVGANLIGLSYGFDFVRGELETADCPANGIQAECGSHPILKRWVWNGTDFSLA